MGSLMWVKLMNLKDYVMEIVIIFIIVFVYIWIDLGEIEILKIFLIIIIFLVMFYVIFKIINRKRKWSGFRKIMC